MDFSEMEVGKWYWFKTKSFGDRFLLGLLKPSYISGSAQFKRLAAYEGDFYQSVVTDIAPVPSQAEWAEIIGLLKDACDTLGGFGPYYVGNGRHLRTLNEKIAEALKKVGEA